jgi:hypothetical protein
LRSDGEDRGRSNAATIIDARGKSQAKFAKDFCKRLLTSQGIYDLISGMSATTTKHKTRFQIEPIYLHAYVADLGYKSMGDFRDALLARGIKVTTQSLYGWASNRCDPSWSSWRRVEDFILKELAARKKEKAK